MIYYSIDRITEGIAVLISDNREKQEGSTFSGSICSL